MQPCVQGTELFVVSARGICYLGFCGILACAVSRLVLAKVSQTTLAEKSRTAGPIGVFLSARTAELNGGFDS